MKWYRENRTDEEVKKELLFALCVLFLLVVGLIGLTSLIEYLMVDLRFLPREQAAGTLLSTETSYIDSIEIKPPSGGFDPLW